jgi:hypothetical protein
MNSQSQPQLFMMRPISAPRASRKPQPIETSPRSNGARAGFFTSAISLFLLLQQFYHGATKAKI